MTIHTLLKNLRDVLPHRRWLPFSGWAELVFILLLVSTLYSTVQAHHQQQQAAMQIQQNQQSALRQLERLALTVQTLQKQLKEGAVSARVVNQHMDTVRAALQHSSQEHCAHMQAILFSEHKKLMERLMQLRTPVATHILHDLPAKALPFRVEGLDYWNGEPRVTIAHHGVFRLLAKNEQELGWTLMQFNFDSGQVVFANKKNQRVKVFI